MLGRRVKDSLRETVSSVQPLDPTKKYPSRPSLYALVSVGIILLEWFYFYEVPYDSIPDKPVFFLSLIAWALPPIFVEWAYVNLPTKRELNAYFNMMIGLGTVGIAVSVAARNLELLVPVALAGMPGAMAGGLVGSDTTLLWTLYKSWRARKENSQEAMAPPEPFGSESQQRL